MERDRDAPHHTQTPLAGRLVAASVGGTLVALFLCPFDVVTRRIQAEQMNVVRAAAAQRAAAAAAVTSAVAPSGGSGGRAASHASDSQKSSPLAASASSTRATSSSNTFSSPLSSSSSSSVTARAKNIYTTAAATASGGGGGGGSATAAPPSLHGGGAVAARSPLQIVLSIVRQEGPFALWRGLWPTLIMYVSTVLLFVWVYVQPRECARSVRSRSGAASRALRSGVGSGGGGGGGGAHLLAKLTHSVVHRLVPANAFYFTTYDALKAKLSSSAQQWRAQRSDSGGGGGGGGGGGNGSSSASPTLPPRATQPPDARFSLIAGPIARTLTVMATSPLELIRTNIQTHAHSADFNEGVGRMLRDIFRAEGVRGLMSGLVPTLWRDVPFSAMYWYMYETIKLQLKAARVAQRRSAAEAGGNAAAYVDKGESSGGDFTVAFLSGAGAGCIAAIVTHPFDVAKTRKQMDISIRRGGAAAVHHHRASGGGLFGTLRTIYRIEGMHGLYGGVVPRLAKIAPACAIMIGCYEFFLRKWQ